MRIILFAFLFILLDDKKITYYCAEQKVFPNKKMNTVKKFSINLYRDTVEINQLNRNNEVLRNISKFHLSLSEKNNIMASYFNDQKTIHKIIYSLASNDTVPIYDIFNITECAYGFSIFKGDSLVNGRNYYYFKVISQKSVNFNLKWGAFEQNILIDKAHLIPYQIKTSYFNEKGLAIKDKYRIFQLKY